MQGSLADQHTAEVGPEFIICGTDAVMAELGAWQARPIERMDAVMRNEPIHLALGVLPRGTHDILVAVIDDLKDLPEARGAVSFRA